MVGVRPAAAPFEDLEIHTPRYDVPRGEVFRRGSVSLHEALAGAIEEIAAFATSSFCDQDLRTV